MPGQAYEYTKATALFKASKRCWFVFDLHTSNTSCYRSTMDLLIAMINLKMWLGKCLSWPFLFLGGIVIYQSSWYNYSLKTTLTPCCFSHTKLQKLLLTELRLVHAVTKADQWRCTIHLFALRAWACLTFTYSQVEMQCWSILTEVGENI